MGGRQSAMRTLHWGCDILPGRSQSSIINPVTRCRHNRSGRISKSRFRSIVCTAMDEKRIASIRQRAADSLDGGNTRATRAGRQTFGPAARNGGRPSRRVRQADIGWQGRAACADPTLGFDPTWWTDDDVRSMGQSRDEREANRRRALHICNSICPVRESCCDYALRQKEPFGIWGGMTKAEREKALGRRLTNLYPVPGSWPRAADDGSGAAASIA